MKIKAALSSEAEVPFEIADVELDEPHADEVLVKLTAVGACYTDISTKTAWPQARSPIVLGHEGAGVVEAVGADVTAVRPGQHVLLSHRACPTCKGGHPTYCRDFSTLHIDLTIAAPLGCGVQTGAGAVLNVLRPKSESSLVAFGAGGVGLSALMVAGAAGVRTIIAVEPVARGGSLPRSLGRPRPSTQHSTTWQARSASSRAAEPRTPSTRPRTAPSSTRRSRRSHRWVRWRWSASGFPRCRSPCRT
jgi:aryl-alcohol dehydrogenase